MPADAPELDLARRLSAYEELRERRIARLPNRQRAQARLVFSGLQQRLLSSVAAFARTLAVHRRTLERLITDAEQAEHATVQAFAQMDEDQAEGELPLEEADAEAQDEADEKAAAEQASLIGALGAEVEALRDELAAVDDTLAIAESAKARPDARVGCLKPWIFENLLDQDRRWNNRRLIVFTEWEDTRRWLERRLKEAIVDTDRAYERIAVFSGITGADRRETIKQAFNADPDHEPLRILICTDAAREGINLQTRCFDLVHFDLPWNPSRLEQRNGRIDRKLQPAKKVFCRYFKYEQRGASGRPRQDPARATPSRAP